MTINDCILITQRLLEEFKINPESHEATEIWGRHFDNWDEDTFELDYGFTEETLNHQMLEWLLHQAEEYYFSDFRERKVNKVAKHFIMSIWKSGKHKGTYDEHSIEDYPFIAKEIAKTLPDGQTQMTYNGRTGRWTKRVIKGGKWVRG